MREDPKQQWNVCHRLVIGAKYEGFVPVGQVLLAKHLHLHSRKRADYRLAPQMADPIHRAASTIDQRIEGNEKEEGDERENRPRHCNPNPESSRQQRLARGPMAALLPSKADER